MIYTLFLRFDSDLNSAQKQQKAAIVSHHEEQRQRDMLIMENSQLEQKLKQLQEDYQKLDNERNEMEADFLKQASSDSDTEVSRCVGTRTAIITSLVRLHH